MLVFKATLPFALAILIISNQALFERKPTNQESPPVDNGCCGCKNSGNAQSRKDNADKQKFMVGKRFEMKVLGKLGRESSGADSEEEESERKKVEVKQGGEGSFGREAGAHFVPDQKREEQDLLGLAEWRKKMLRRMG